ncbi:MAG: acyl-CoA thioesterase [Planctomycetales bacterium]
MDAVSEAPYLALKALMMPRDTNAHGTIFGGVILSYMDQAGAIGARHTLLTAGAREKPLVSVAIDRVEFLKPIYVGDVVSFITNVTRTGKTSLTVQVVVNADRKGESVEMTRGSITYVTVELGAAGHAPVNLDA